MIGRSSKLSTNSKALVLMILLFLQSCALVTSYKKFDLERNPKLTFSKRITYSSENSGVLFFFEDGTFLKISPMTSSSIENYFERLDYKIYGRFSDYRLHWGRYQLKHDSVQIELLEKVHQWGFMGITRWNAVVKNQGKAIEILPGPVNTKVRTVYAPIFDYKGEIFLQDSTLQDVKIEPEKAWVNK